MTDKIHRLKTWPEYFQNVIDGNKTYEIRKDDRDFMSGDIVILEEWNPVNGEYTGRIIRFQIGTVIREPAWGLQQGYCVFSLIALGTVRRIRFTRETRVRNLVLDKTPFIDYNHFIL